MSNRWLPSLILCLVGGALVVPFVIVAGVSVNPVDNISFPPRGFTLAWYQRLFGESQWLVPIWNSTKIALAAAVIATSLALSANY